MSRRTPDGYHRCMAMPKAGPQTIAAYERVAGAFVARGAKKSSMFGMPVLKAKDKMFAGTFGDAMTSSSARRTSRRH